MTVSAASVFLLAAGHPSWKLAYVLIGVFLSACGACALNQYQERATDSLMARTKDRPLPSGRIPPRTALCAAVLLSAGGALLLLNSAGATASGLACLGVIWYAGVYTPLKEVTAFAVIPGSLIGALAPAIGWTAAGAPLADGRLGALVFFFCMWQVPHFWLLALRCGDDYHKAGLPALTDTFSTAQLGRIVFSWMMVSAASCLLLPLFGAVSSGPVLCLLTTATAWMSWKAAALLGEGQHTLRAAFMHVNLFALAVMSLIALDPHLR